ncbi:MAG: DUF4465 domain-containing protein [Mariniphaga sp.]
MEKIKRSGITIVLIFTLFASCKKENLNSVETKIVNFENLTLGSSLFWNGSDLTGKFQSSDMAFDNNFNSSYGSWDGFVYSQKNDIIASDYTNQYSVFDGSNGTNKFTLYYPPFGSDEYATFLNDSAYLIKSIKICNSTYTALTIKKGDPSFAKKFGGVSGNDPDWFKMTVIGYNAAGDSVKSLDFYLADFRFTDNTKDYIVNKWTLVNLSSLGKVNKLTFRFSSTDNGDYGMNTPAYVCLDDLEYERSIPGSN